MVIENLQTHNDMRTINGFRLRKLGNEYILVGESVELINFNKMITLNETAAFLWQSAEENTARHGSFTASDLCDALCKEYDVAPEKAMTDVDATLHAWSDAGVIE
jgi:hypothetical protein